MTGTGFLDWWEDACDDDGYRDVGTCRECGNDTPPGYTLCLGCRTQRDLDEGRGDVPESEDGE